MKYRHDHLIEHQHVTADTLETFRRPEERLSLEFLDIPDAVQDDRTEVFISIHLSALKLGVSRLIAQRCQFRPRELFSRWR